MISSFTIKLLGIISMLILVKMWGGFSASALGSIGFAISIISLFNILGDMGFSQAHIKRISEGLDLGRCIGTYIAIKMFFVCLSLLVIFCGLYIWDTVFGGGFTDATAYPIFLVMIFYNVFSTIRAISRDTFIGLKQIAKHEVTLLMENLTKLPLLVIVVFAGVTGVVVAPFNWGFFLPLQRSIADNPVMSLALTYVLGMFFSMVVGFYLLKRCPIKKPSWFMFKKYFVFAIPITFSSVASIISTNIDKVMIGFFWTSVEVGYYFVVQRITGFLFIFSAAVSTILFPTISSYHSKNNFKEIKKTVHLAERYISMILVPPVIFILLFSNVLIRVMLDDVYLPASMVLTTLSVWVLIKALSVPYITLLTGMNKPKFLAVVGISMYSINIFLNYVFIPVYGAVGAAVATVCSSLIMFFGTRLYAKRLVDIDVFQFNTLLHLVAGLFMGGVLYFIFCNMEFFYWYHLILFAVVGLLLYVFVLYVFKEFKKEDWFFFKDLVNPKKTLLYMKDELKGER